MAAVDDRIRALGFTAETSRNREEIARLIADAAELAAASGGEKVTLSEGGDGVFSGVVKNFVRVTHAEFVVRILPGADGRTRVAFEVGDYFRSRDVLFLVIPVGPWSAPAYKTLHAFSEHLRHRL